MNVKLGVPLLTVLLLTAACQKEEPAAGSPESSSSAAPAAGTETASPPVQAEGTPAAATPASSAATGGAPIASQETNWAGIVAEVTEFRRKGNTLTAKVRLRNQGTAEVQPEILYKEVYLMDLGAGKKYEALQDEKGAYIAALRQNWTDRWYEEMAPGEAQTIWIKFPAPPADVKAVTLQIPSVPPFEDLPIQDS